MACVLLTQLGRSILGGTFQAIAVYTPLVGGTVGFLGSVMLLLWLVITLLNLSEKYIGAQAVNHLMTWILRSALVVRRQMDRVLFGRVSRMRR